jgi:amino acid transporter
MEIQVPLKRDLGLIEAISLSTAMLAPTIAMSFNTVFAVQAAGAAAPLAFLIGTVAMLIVGACFASFERRVRSHGSVYSYLAHTFGARCGFTAGWTLLFAYAASSAASAVLAGIAGTVLLSKLGGHGASLWLWIALFAVVATGWTAWRDTKAAVRVMLAMEGFSMMIIVALAVKILYAVRLSWVPLRPDATHGWAGVGYAMVFAALAFAGFEGAATLSQETRNPRRAIPLALACTLLLSGAFYVLVTYAEVVGYGLGHVADLASAESPLSALAERYMSLRYSLCIDVAVFVSAGASTLGTAAAGARMLRALSLGNRWPRFAGLDPKHGTPRTALVVISALSAAGICIWGVVALADPLSYCLALITMATLAFILVYLGVTVAACVEAFRVRRVGSMALSGLGALLLLWPLWNNVYPVPAFPANLWPYAVAAWVVGGAIYAWRSKSGGGIEAEPVEELAGELEMR